MTMMQTDQSTEHQAIGILYMVLLSLAVGIIAGLGAVVFRALIGLFHNLLFLGTLSLEYNANVHTPGSPWGGWVILIPVIGAVGVAFLVKTFAPEAKGHGVPEVMDSIYYGKGRIRPVVAIVKWIASALSIGSGGSVGREGPIIQIGSAFGSTLGQLIRIPVHQRITLIAAGAAGGIAATFNTPVGGLAFAIELMLPTIKTRTVLPVSLATVTATYIGRYFLGMLPAFNVPALTIPAQQLLHPGVLLAFGVFGILLGLVAALFVRSIYWFEDRFDAIPGNYYTRHTLGMLMVGVMIWLLMRQTGHYYVQGVGYATIEDILRGALSSPAFLLLLVGLKLLATCLTLGSGASGGIFSPGLFIGAALGGCLGPVAQRIFPSLGFDPATFAVAGMAAMVGGTTGAVVTGVIMIFEMTRDLNAILPVMVTVAICCAVRKALVPPSIYTLKLLRRGHVVPEGLQAALDDAHVAKDVMSQNFIILRVTDKLSQLPVRQEGAPRNPVIVLRREEEVVGVLTSKPNPPDAGASDSLLGDSADNRFVFVGENEPFIEVLSSLQTKDAVVALVTRKNSSKNADSVVGFISDGEIATAIRTRSDVFR